MLSERIRANSEAAPWVVEEVKKLENRIKRIEQDVKYSARNLQEFVAFHGGEEMGVDLELIKKIWNAATNSSNRKSYEIINKFKEDLKILKEQGKIKLDAFFWSGKITTYLDMYLNGSLISSSSLLSILGSLLDCYNDAIYEIANNEGGKYDWWINLHKRRNE